LSSLAKAIARFPPGVPDRWEHVANYVGTRSIKDIIAKSQETKYAPTKINELCKVEDAYDRFNKQKKRLTKRSILL